MVKSMRALFFLENYYFTQPFSCNAVQENNLSNTLVLGIIQCKKSNITSLKPVMPLQEHVFKGYWQKKYVLDGNLSKLPKSDILLVGAVNAKQC